MALTVGMVTVFAHYALHLSWGSAGRHRRACRSAFGDRLRFNLTCEAWMNDGTAFALGL